jgi:hypothetical protein
MRLWLAAPDRTDGEEAAWDARPPNDRVSVVAHCPVEVPEEDGTLSYGHQHDPI